MGFEYLLNGDSGNDVLIAGINSTTNIATQYQLNGGDGDDTLETGEGNHILDGGETGETLGVGDTAIYHSNLIRDEAVRLFLDGTSVPIEAILAALPMLFNYDFKLIDDTFDGIQVSDEFTISAVAVPTIVVTAGDFNVGDITVSALDNSAPFEYTFTSTTGKSILMVAADGETTLLHFQSDGVTPGDGAFEILGADDTVEVRFTYTVTDINGDTQDITQKISIEGEVTENDIVVIQLLENDGFEDGTDLIIADVTTAPVLPFDITTRSSIEIIDFNGKQYTLVNGVETLSSSSEVIDVTEGDDYLMVGGENAGSGTYALVGNVGNDILFGGLNTGMGLYTFEGEAGNDLLIGGNNTGTGLYGLQGGDDNDILIAGSNTSADPAAYQLLGGDGDDILETGEGNHVLDGGEDVTEILGDTAVYHSDVLGGAARNFIDTATPTSTQINAVVAAAAMLLNYDFSLTNGLFSGIEVDNQVGTDGTDIIVADILTPNEAGSEFPSLGSSIETINFDGKDYVLSNGVFSNSAGSFEQISFDTFSDSTLLVGGENTGNGSRYELVGGINHDIVVGGENTDTGDFIGYTLVGNEGNDILVGGENSATNADIDDENTYDLFGGLGNDILLGGSNTSDGLYNLFGEGGNDVLIAGSNTGAASLYVLSGGDGEDILVDGNGDHTLTGDTGTDTFVFGFLDLTSGISSNNVVDDFLTNNNNMLEMNEDILKFTNVTSVNAFDNLSSVEEDTITGYIKLVFDPNGIPNSGDESSIVFTGINFISGNTDIDDYINPVQIVLETS